MKHCLYITAGTSRGNDRHNLACASSYLKSLHILLLLLYATTSPQLRRRIRHPCLNSAQATSHSSSTTRLLRSGAGGDNDDGDQFWHDFALKRCSCTIPIAGPTRPSISHTELLFSSPALTTPTAIPRFGHVCSLRRLDISHGLMLLA